MTIKITADFMENEKGELLLAIPEIDGEPNSPTLTFNHDLSAAALNRSHNQKVEIENIHPDVRSKLLKASKVLVTEVTNNGIKNGYYATITK